MKIRKWEWALLALVLVTGAWLRFSHLDLLEFQGDEAYASNLALDFVSHGRLPLAGLMSSVGVTNPPLFIYLLIPLFAISTNPTIVSCGIALLSLGAVAACWRIGRRYYGPVAGLVAAAFFAVSPWAVIYSRKIWAQDFVPIFATATLWALHTLVLGKRPKAVFWVVLLPLCVVQIHFSGLAMTAGVLAVLLALRPRIDWRYAAGGLAAAVLLMVPYLRLQSETDWADIKQAMNTVGGGQHWDQLNGITTHPVTGYRLPSRDYLAYALDIMNGGDIADVLGISANSAVDSQLVYAHKGDGTQKYFAQSLTLGDWLLLVQRIVFVAALAWIGFVAVRGLKKFTVEGDAARAGWLLVLWTVVPLAVFFVTGLWVYLTYFVILYPVHFLVCGAAAEKLAAKQRWLVAAAVAVLVAGNVVFMLDYYSFVGNNGGAQGTFGSALGYKQTATRFLAGQGGERLRRESELQLALATSRSREERARLAQSLGQPMLLELNHQGQPEMPQMEWPLLITQAPGAETALSTNTAVVLVDRNREALPPELWQRLAAYPATNFGPIWLYFVQR